MRTVKMLAAALLSAVVFADSAPGESDVSARKIRVACVGDSITWGYAMTNRVEECYPAQLQKILGDRYEVVNFGNSGSCVYSEPKTGPSGWRPHPWRPGGAAAYAFKPDIVVSGLGANDASIHMFEYIYDENGVPKTEPGLFRREYIDLLKEFEKDGRSPKFIVWTKLAPLGKKHITKGKPDPFVLRHDLEAVARAVGAVELDMYTPLVPYAETDHYAADGVHPEGGAQRVIAEVVAQAIRAMAGACSAAARAEPRHISARHTCDGACMPRDFAKRLRRGSPHDGRRRQGNLVERPRGVAGSRERP